MVNKNVRDSQEANADHQVQNNDDHYVRPADQQQPLQALREV